MLYLYNVTWSLNTFQKIFTKSKIHSYIRCSQKHSYKIMNKFGRVQAYAHVIHALLFTFLYVHTLITGFSTIRLILIFLFLVY